MSLSPEAMDFIEARHTAAREIALAHGVPEASQRSVPKARQCGTVLGMTA